MSPLLFLSRCSWVRYAVVLAVAAWAAAPAVGQLQFTTEAAPATSSKASALAEYGEVIYLFRSGVGDAADGRLFASPTGMTGDWWELPSAASSMPGTAAGEIYGGAMAYWPGGGGLVAARWNDPGLPGQYPWDKDRAAYFDEWLEEWVLLDGGANPELNSGFVIIGDMVYGIQHGGGQPLRRLDLTGSGTSEGTMISGVDGDDASWFSRASKLAVADGLIYGIKNDWTTGPRGTGDRLFRIDPADWGADNGATPAADLGRLPFEVGAGSTIVALPAEWSSGGAGALFISAGMSPSDGEGNWHADDNASDLYAIYDMAGGTFEVGHLPGPAGKGTSAVFANGALFVMRGMDGTGAYGNDLWVGQPFEEEITDLDVTYIERLPRYDYDGIPNQPQQGETVTFRGHVVNLSTHEVAAAGYVWRLDGRVVLQDAVNDLAAGEERVVSWSWAWEAGDHTVSLTVDPQDEIAEFSEANNVVRDRTNGIIVGFWVEQSVYDYFRRYQRELGGGVGSNSWEDWAQRQMGQWNVFCEEAVYPLSPFGVLDRVRIDKVVVVPDGALPLGPWGLPTNNPDVRDRTVDMMWGFTAEALNTPFYADHTTVSMGNAFYHERSLLHELGHARYLIDCYGFDVHDGQVQITEGGEPVAGSALMPFIAYDSVLYYNHSGGIMTGPYEDAWSPYEAAALNLIAGQRATCGNYNAPCNIGVFLQDLPAANHVCVVDRYGRPRAGANVRLYRAGPQADVWYGKMYDDVADAEYTADWDGVVHLPQNPFADGPVEIGYGYANGVVIARVEHAGEVWYRFLEVSDFNLAYWAGDTADAHYELMVEGAELLASDFDADGDVDLDDFAAFAGCLTGPAVDAAGSCAGKDLNGDGPVDLRDWAVFEGDFTGE